MVLVISERCSCGAKFSVHDCNLADAKKLVREWRRGHECQQSEADVSMVASTVGAVVERSDNVLGFRWSAPEEIEEDKR